MTVTHCWIVLKLHIHIHLDSKQDHCIIDLCRFGGRMGVTIDAPFGVVWLEQIDIPDPPSSLSSSLRSDFATKSVSDTAAATAGWSSSFCKEDAMGWEGRFVEVRWEGGFVGSVMDAWIWCWTFSGDKGKRWYRASYSSGGIFLATLKRPWSFSLSILDISFFLHSDNATSCVIVIFCPICSSRRNLHSCRCSVGISILAIKSRATRMAETAMQEAGYLVKP